MSIPSICRVAAAVPVVSFGLLSSACTPKPSVAQSWSGPGFYLQMPYLIAAAGPVYVGGPWSYDKCEEERAKQPPETATQMMCIRENRKPDTFGRS